MRSLGYQLAGRGVRVTPVYLPLVDTAMTAGRGSGKISAAAAAAGVLDGLRRNRKETFVGKAGLVRWLHRQAHAADVSTWRRRHPAPLAIVRVPMHRPRSRHLSRQC